MMPKGRQNLVLFGFFFVAPALKTWYGSLEKFVPKKYTSFQRGIAKMACDQSIFAPTFTVVITYLVSLVNGESLEQIKQRLRNDYVTIMLKNYQLWPAAQIINFTVIPLQYQVLFAQSVAVIWNCYLSWMLNKDSEPKKKSDV